MAFYPVATPGSRHVARTEATAVLLGWAAVKSLIRCRNATADNLRLRGAVPRQGDERERDVLRAVRAGVGKRGIQCGEDAPLSRVRKGA